MRRSVRGNSQAAERCAQMACPIGYISKSPKGVTVFCQVGEHEAAVFLPTPTNPVDRILFRAKEAMAAKCEAIAAANKTARVKQPFPKPDFHFVPEGGTMYLNEGEPDEQGHTLLFVKVTPGGWLKEVDGNPLTEGAGTLEGAEPEVVEAEIRDAYRRAGLSEAEADKAVEEYLNTLPK